MLIFDGPHCFGRSVCRLRVANPPRTDRIVIATHLEDSPGASIANDFEGLVASVERDFGSRPTRWLLHFPEPSESWIDATPMLGGSTGCRMNLEDAERLAGLPLRGADTGPTTLAELASDRDVLLNAVQGEDPERLCGEYLRIVPVAALPFCHGPFRCPYQPRFDDISRLYPDTETPAAGAHWFLTLSKDDFAECPYHAVDWRRIAAASVAALKAAGPQATRDDLAEAFDAQQLSARDREWLLTLLTEPIDWTPGATRLTNGQHRACALRAAGATAVIVDTDGFPPPRRYARSPRAAARALLAAHWAAESVLEEPDH